MSRVYILGIVLCLVKGVLRCSVVFVLLGPVVGCLADVSGGPFCTSDVGALCEEGGVRGR